MSYKVKTIPYFDRQAERLTRKFQSFKNELSELSDYTLQIILTILLTKKKGCSL